MIRRLARVGCGRPRSAQPLRREGHWAQIRELAKQKLFERASNLRRVRQRRVRMLMFMVPLHSLNGSLTAPPVGPGRLMSPTNRTAPQLGGAMGAGAGRSVLFLSKVL